MRSKHFAKLTALLLGATLAGCGSSSSPAAAHGAGGAIQSNGVTGTLTLQSDYGSGYCANVTLANGGTAAVTGWTAVVTLENSTLSQLWSATSAVSGSQVTVTPLSWNAAIAPGASVTFGFCATASSSTHGATLSSLTVTGGTPSTTSYTLTVQTSGSGTTSPAAGTASYAAGTVVQVTATPASGYTFAGWSGAATGTTNPVSVTVDASKTLTATFSPTTTTGYTLTITTSGGGTTSPAAGTYRYAAGTSVQVTATAAAGNAFSGWSGAATGTANPVSVAMNGNKTLTATFTATTTGSDVSLNAGGSATGGWAADAYYSGGSAYTSGNTVDTSALGAGAPPAAVFQSERYGEFTYTIPNRTAGSAQTVTLYFSEGYVTASGQRLFNVAINGTTVLSAFDIYAAAGGANKAVARSFTTTADSGGRVVIAFTRGTVQNPKVDAIRVVGGGTVPTGYALDVTRGGTGTGTVTGSGIDCGATCSASYAAGTRVTLTAAAASGSTFGGWGGACSGTSTCVVTMSAAQAVTATFTSSTPPTGYTVAVVQSSRAQASDLTAADIATMVQSAVTQAGGLDFIRNGQTVVLKPNLLTAYTDGGSTPADPFVNGIDTDWRVAKAVADLVRAKNPSGKILIMEGSVNATPRAFSILGYTAANFGSSVDEFIAVEGASCADKSTTALVQRTGRSGKSYWVNSRFLNADVVISLPVMKTHAQAGITGGVKNLGIGMTPVGQYSAGTNASDNCGRTQNATYIDHSSPEALGAFIRDYYGLRPADFVVMDALQGLENGPLPAWSGGASYAASKKNMRLILAARNAVALDTVAAQIMMCDPRKVPHLTKLEADGLGSADPASITVVGTPVSAVAKPFAGSQKAICPGTAPSATFKRPAGYCQAGVTYPAPILTGSPRLLYRPSGTVSSGTFEGPVWLTTSSTLLFSDISFTGTVNPSQLLRATSSGAVTTVAADAGLNGMSLDAAGAVYAASHKVQGIVRVDAASGAQTTVVDNVGGKKFNSPNDLVVRSDGTIYFTDPDFQLGNRTSQTGKKGVYRVSPGGAVSLVDDTFAEPNGIALSPDETVLYVADYNGNAVRAFTVAADGSTSGKRTFATVSSPDGFGMDCLGDLYVASGSSIQVFSPAGRQLGSVSVAASLSNMAFGGTDGKTLYLTAGKALYALDLNLPGYRN